MPIVFNVFLVFAGKSFRSIHLNAFQTVHNVWKMGISKNRGTPKSSILIGFSTINHPFSGTPVFGNTHIGMQISRPKSAADLQTYPQSLGLYDEDLRAGAEFMSLLQRPRMNLTLLIHHWLICSMSWEMWFWNLIEFVMNLCMFSDHSIRKFHKNPNIQMSSNVEKQWASRAMSMSYMYLICIFAKYI